MEKDTSARIRGFIREDLVQLQTDLYSAGMKKASKNDIASALIRAAHRSPIEAVKAVIESYWEAEAAAYPGGTGQET
jgi:hypothetical protein